MVTTLTAPSPERRRRMPQRQKSRVFPQETRKARFWRLRQVEMAFEQGLLLENPTLAIISTQEARDWFQTRIDQFMIRQLASEGIQIPAGANWRAHV